MKMTVAKFSQSLLNCLYDFCYVIVKNSNGFKASVSSVDIYQFINLYINIYYIFII